MTGFRFLARRSARLIPAPLLRALRRPAIVYFHGVEEAIDDPRVQRVHHRADVFFELATRLKRDHDVLPLDALGAAMAQPRKFRNALFLTCDDGYRNNLTVAEPILRDLALPWTLFVSTAHIDAGKRLPTFLARLFAFYAPPGRYDIAGFEAPIVLSGDADRAGVARGVVGRLKAMPAGDAQAALDMMCERLGGTLPALLDRFRSDELLTWDEVAELRRRGVAIGAHADRHWAMHSGQTIAYLQEQAQRSRARIEAKIGACRHFAYPFGDLPALSAAGWQAVRDAGYDFGFTTLEGLPHRSQNPFLMPRFALAMPDALRDAASPLPYRHDPRLAGRQRAL